MMLVSKVWTDKYILYENGMHSYHKKLRIELVAKYIFCSYHVINCCGLLGCLIWPQIRGFFFLHTSKDYVHIHA